MLTLARVKLRALKFCECRASNANRSYLPAGMPLARPGNWQLGRGTSASVALPPPLCVLSASVATVVGIATILHSPPLTESSHYTERQTIVGGVNSENPIAVSARKRLDGWRQSRQCLYYTSAGFGRNRPPLMNMPLSQGEHHSICTLY